MASDSGQRFIKRNRPPRVHISYEDPHDANRQIELPFVVGVMSDLSGNASEVEKPEFDDRKMLDIDMDNFDERLSAIEPGLAFSVRSRLSDDSDEKMSVSLKFKKMDDFSPVAVARQVPALAKLLEAREQLSNLTRYMDGKVAAEDKLKELLSDPQLMAALNERAAQETSDNTEAGESEEVKSE